MEFKEFEPRFKSSKPRFKLSAGLNLETFDTILSGNQPYLSRGLNLNRRSNSLNSAIEMEFKEFDQRFKSAKTRFKFSAGLNLQTFDTNLSGTNHI